MSDGAAEAAAPGSAAPAARAQLMALLNDEIAALHAEAGRGGWNIWVLAAALVGALHVAGDLWASHSIDLPLTARWAVVLGVGTYLVLPVLANAHTPRAPRGRLPRTQPARQAYRRFRWATAVLFLETIALAMAAQYGGVGVVPAVVTWATFIFTLGTVGWAYVFVVSFTPLQVPSEGPSEDVSWVLVAALVALFYAAVLSIVIGFAAGLRWPPPGGSLIEIRLAALGVAVGTLLWLLGAHGPPDPRLHELQDLRRRLALGALADADAPRAIEVALRGLDVTARLELRLERGERAFQRAAAAYGTATTRLDTLEADLARADSAQQGSSDALPAIDAPARRHLRKLLGGATKADKQARRDVHELAEQLVQLRLILYRALPTLSDAESALVMERIHPRFERLLAETAAAQTQLEAMDARLRAARASLDRR